MVPFLRAARARLPEGMGRRTGRADRGFCAGAFLDFLEAQAWPYVVGARLATTLQRQGAGRKEWTALDEHHAAGAFTVKLYGWTKERRFVVVRERVRESKAAVGRKLIDGPGDTFRVWVTSRSEAAVTLWRGGAAWSSGSRN